MADATSSNPTETLIDLLDKSIRESALEDFRRYIHENKQWGDFCFASDYCLDDPGKPNNVMTFTVMPSLSGLQSYQKEIDRLLPRDLKKVKSISEDAIGLLRSNKFFHFNFVIIDNGALTRHPIKSGQKAAIDGLNSSIDAIKKWSHDDPNGENKFDTQINKLKLWIKELNKSSPNLRLFRNIVLNGTLAAYVAHLISFESQSKQVTWFGDRDKMQSYDRVVEDIFYLTHFAICERNGRTTDLPSVSVATLEASKEDRDALWYDSLIRIPDYMAGSLASWTWGSDDYGLEKHRQMILEVIADNKYCSISRLNLKSELFSVGHTKVHLKE